LGEMARRWVRVWGVRKEVGEGVRLLGVAAAAATQQVAGWGLGEVARRWVRVWGVREEAGEGVRLVAR